MATPYNASHVQFDGHLFNETVLNEYNYTIWGNGTLSNSSSHCWLVYGIFDVTLLPNGTAVNGTKCESPVKPIATRGGLGIAFGILFALMIILGITCLSKHGKSYTPAEKRFRLVSRRWPWYWFLVTGACGCISGLVSVDADRAYLPGTGLILQNAFYYVMLSAMLGSVWEMTRHWGSFCERRLVDEDPWQFVHTDLRNKIEFYNPLVFYLFAFLTFFLSVLRSWTPIPKGAWSGDHSVSIAAATDGRFKASAIFGLFAWFAIIASVITSLTYYPTVAHRMPAKIPLCLSFLVIRIIYNIAVAWEYNIGPLRLDAHVAYVYVLGYAPILFCMLTMVFWGKIEMNEDLKLIKLRRERERRLDSELGILPGQQRRETLKGEQLKPTTSDESEGVIKLQ